MMKLTIDGYHHKVLNKYYKWCVELGFSRSTFMKMIHENYRPKSGALAMYEVKREML
jgi:hypothetical protein